MQFGLPFLKIPAFFPNQTVFRHRPPVEVRSKFQTEEIFSMMLDPLDAYEDIELMPQNTGQELIKFMNDWGNISGRRDTEKLDEMLSGDLVVTMFDGRVLTKTEYLDSLKSLPADFRLTDYDQTAQIFDHTAIVRAACRFETGGREMHLRYTATFIKRDGKWDIVAFHSSDLPKS
jgi:hypothetical protein